MEASSLHSIASFARRSASGVPNNVEITDTSTAKSAPRLVGHVRKSVRRWRLELDRSHPTLGVAFPEEPVIESQPPDPIEEILPDHRPADENVIWTPGYWYFDQDEEDFVWISGLWRSVPPGRQWVPGYWNQVSSGYQWVAGTWIRGDGPVSFYPEPPQSQERGPSSVAPSANHFYVPGFQERAFATLVELRWFLSEQVEENESVRDIVRQSQMVKDDPWGIVEIDRGLGTRTTVA